MPLTFNLIPVDKKPVNRYTKKMYKDIIKEFIFEKYELAEVIIEVENKSYVKNRLQNCIEEMGVQHKVIVSIVNNRCYLERF